MKLSDAKARRLTQLVWRAHARRWLPIVVIALGLLGVVAFFMETQIDRADRTVDVQVHAGTVIDVKRGAARGVAIVHVRLDDGREVDAFSALRLTPQAGSHVVINEGHHASGHLTYDVARFAE